MERLGVVVSMQSGCSKCGKPAVYLRRYTSEHLCGACLVETTIDRVRKTINKHKMLYISTGIVALVTFIVATHPKRVKKNIYISATPKGLQLSYHF